MDGVRCYSSTDLYNWTDHGTILYTQSTILPIEEGTEKAITSSVGANGTGTTQEYNVMQRSKTNLETLKAWGKLSTAPEGVTESEFRNVKNFLRAYVTEYEKAPTDLNDISWTAKTYDEEPITATSLLYPDSTDESVRNVTTTRLQLAFETLYGSYCITERPKMIYNESTKQFSALMARRWPAVQQQRPERLGGRRLRWQLSRQPLQPRHGRHRHQRQPVRPLHGAERHTHEL